MAGSAKAKLPAGCREDCTVLCRSLQHAAEVVACVLGTPHKYSPNEAKVYLRALCWNFSTISDRFGRTALHAAASSGSVELIEWLIDTYHADPNQVDLESGWSALHRASFYGHLGAVCALIQRGASLELADKEGFTPLDFIVSDRVPWAQYSLANPCSVYVWGTDENHSLGLGPQKVSSMPKLHSGFTPHHRVQSVVVERYHTVFLTAAGGVWACGYGYGGRLGMGDEASCLIPQQIPTFRRLGTVIVQVAAGQDHTLFLDNEGTVYTCGLNNHYQLGLSSLPDKLLEPLSLNSRHFLLEGCIKIRGVSAGKYHSALWTETALYTWGLNAGQLGHPKQGTRNQVLPRKVAAIDSGATIDFVSSGEGAIGVVTNSGDVYLVHDYHVRRVASQLTDIVKILVVGGNVDHERLPADAFKCADLRALVLNRQGDLLLWEGRNQAEARVVLNARIAVADFALSAHGNIDVVSKQGEVFSGTLSPSMAAPQTGWSSRSRGGRRGTDRTLVAFIDGKRLPNLHRAVTIASDPAGRRFIALQNGPEIGVQSVASPSLRPEKSHLWEDIGSLLQMDEALGDVVVTCLERTSAINGKAEVESEGVETSFVLHSPVLTARSQFFCKALRSNNQLTYDAHGRITCVIDNISSKDLMHVIGLMYTCATLQSQKQKEAYEIDPTFKVNQKAFLKRDGFTNIFLETDEGDYREPAHRCVLACRSEFFRALFSFGGRDSRSDTIRLPLGKDTLRALLEYIYTDCCPSLKTSSDALFLCDVLAIADMLLLPGLKQLAEQEIFSKFLTLEGVCDLFELAARFCAASLIQVCADFICVNLTAILEGRRFDNLTTEGLTRLGHEYRVTLRDVDRRVLGGEVNSPSKKLLTTVFNRFKDSLTDDTKLINIYEGEKNLSKSRTRPRVRRASDRNPSVLSGGDHEKNVRLSESAETQKASQTLTPSENLSTGCSPEETIPQEPLLLASCSLELDNREAFPDLGSETPLTSTPPRSSGRSSLRISSTSDSIGGCSKTNRRIRHRPLEEVLDSTPRSIAKCPWGNASEKQDKNGNLPTTTSALAEVIEAEEQQRKHLAWVTVARADAEDRAIADLLVVYEVGYNPDERVSIERVQESLSSGPVWARHPMTRA